MKLLRCLHRRSLLIWLFAVILTALLLTGCAHLDTLPTPTPIPTPESTPEPTPEPTPDLTEINAVISELMASNETCLRDEDGDFADWVELYNPSESRCELTGFWLSDSEKELKKWRIPSLVIEPGQYAVIYLSGKDRSEHQLHTNFALSRHGDELLLSSPLGYELLRVSFEELDKDSSLCIDGEGQTMTFLATPGYPNTEEGREAFIQATDVQNELLINEFVTHNSNYNYHAGAFYDWVEFKNNSDDVLDLSDYYITDDLSDPFQYQLPKYNLAAGRLFMLDLGEPEGTTNVIHAPFGLDCYQDALYIFRADGTLCDYVGVNDIPLNCSKGRLPGQSGFFLFGTRTPNKENTGGCRFHCEVPAFVTAPGVYNGVESVQVQLAGEGTIRYTTDGSIPTEASPVYEGPITLTATTCLRIASFEPGKQQSNSAAAGYIINENHTLPVVSVAMDPKDVNYIFKYNNDYDMDASFSFYGPDGSFSRNCAVSIHGASSRTVQAKKSLKFIFKDRYGGDLNTDFDLFGNGITEFHSILMRGQDTGGMHLLRDPLVSLVAIDTCVTDPLTLDARYAVMYINGKYYGLYDLRESYSPKYVAEHTGSDEAASVIIRAPFVHNDELMDLYHYMCYNDMANEENFAYVADRFDMQTFAQWICYESYFNNLDPTGNIRYCKGNVPDSKWRVMLFDLDIAMGSAEPSMNPLYQLDSQLGNIMATLDNSPTFRTLVVETASQIYQNGLHYDTVLAKLDEMAGEIASEVGPDMKHWHDIQDYDGNLMRQRNVFTQERDVKWVKLLQRYSGFDDETMKQYFPDFYE